MAYAEYERQLVIAASAARTAAPTIPAQWNMGGRGVHVIVDVTSAGTGSITVTVQGYDRATNAWYDILASAALTTNATTKLTVFPGATAVANTAANDCIPHKWRVNIAHNNGNSITYSVGANILE